MRLILTLPVMLWLHFGLANVRAGAVFRCDAESYTRTLLTEVLSGHSALQGPMEQFNPAVLAAESSQGFA